MDYRFDAMIARAERAGTTSLGLCLGIHSRILWHLGLDARSPRIGLDAFPSGASEEPDRLAREFRAAFPRDPRSGDFVLAKSVSLLHEPDASRRLRRHNPNCRLVISLRNPVDRAYSSYWYQRYRGAERAADSGAGTIVAAELDAPLSREPHQRGHSTAGTRRPPPSPTASAARDRTAFSVCCRRCVRKPRPRFSSSSRRTTGASSAS